jgi:hypothetical protein
MTAPEFPPLPPDEALRRWPVLQKLIDARRVGWSFAHAEQGSAQEITGLRVWPDGSADVMRFRSETDAEALRINPDDPPGIVWKRDGTLDKVIDGLRELPPPGHPYAPWLVLGSAPPQPLTARLWWPR